MRLKAQFCWAGLPASVTRSVLALAFLGGPARAERWWHSGWEGRVQVKITVGEAVLRTPVVLAGGALFQAGVPQRIPVGSLRVVGTAGEVASQVDERDGTGELTGHGNKVLDSDDELVFPGAISGKGPARYFIYFSRHPRPPGRYASLLHYGRPSAAFNKMPLHGVFYGREFKVGVKGPKSPEPTVNKLDNFCSGAISALRWKGHNFVRPVNSWTWFIPRHPFGSGPAKVHWSLPELIIDGPVRKTVRLVGTGLEAPVRRVQHDFMVYADSPVVDFVESISYEQDDPKIKLAYSFPLALAPGFATAAGRESGLAERRLTGPDMELQAGGKVVKVYRSTEMKDPAPWWAWASQTRKVGLAILFARQDGKVLPGGRWSAWAYARSNVSHTQVILHLQPGKRVRHSMRFICISDFKALPAMYRMWSEPAKRWAQWNPVETR